MHSTLRAFPGLCFLALVVLPFPANGEEVLDQIHSGFQNPPVDCRPHTRWWWMGNALREEDIAWQLDQMHTQGIGGVEQISMEPVYEKGNHEYLSPDYFHLLKYAVEQARIRGLEFSVNFGGPGWIWGGDWVPKEDQSKVLLASMLALDGPKTFSGSLSDQATPNPNDLPRSTPTISSEDGLVAVVAGRLEQGRLRADSLVDLSSLARGRNLTWDVPPGQWQLMGFWLTQRDNHNAVDHLSQGAMERYCEVLGTQLGAAIGEHLGKTVESFFGDSFEVPIYRNGLYWTDGLFEAFRNEHGYDLVPWLPALWWEVEDLSPKVRYDVNQFLHEQGMRAFFETFLNWCKQHGVRGRVQPYGFVTDVIEGAGRSDLPEMEITAGEKDAVPWFDPRIGPKEYVASGAHLYGRNVVTAEAFTYLHWQPYRETLEELKIATDGFLRAGANKLYNHGFLASPERGIVPTRGFFAAIRISPENIWWPYYHLLADYTARCCWLLRQGKYVADVAVYSPLANQWTKSVLNARRWTRDFDWGGLQTLLSTNGYGYDLVNDEMLQDHASWEGPLLHVGEMTYRVLILPEIEAMPLASLQQVEAYVRQGGTVIALEQTPRASTGMQDHAQWDSEVRRISQDLFPVATESDDMGTRVYGQGRASFLETVLHREDPLDWKSAPLDPFLKVLRQSVGPDMEVDLVRAGRRNNEGLVCIHRRLDSADLYFVANLQDSPVNDRVGFRIPSGVPQVWDPRSGERRAIHAYARDGEYTRMSLSMEPYESRFILFENTDHPVEPPHIVESDFHDILDATAGGIVVQAAHNGPHAYRFFDGNNIRSGTAMVEGLPASYEINGLWRVQFLGENSPPEEFSWTGLKGWTEDDRLRHFSGCARYSISFNLPGEFFRGHTSLVLSLGVVGNVAEIRVNGKPVGTHWMSGQTFRLDDIAQPGNNSLEVVVTNTLINRVSGLKEFPPVPMELQEHFGQGLEGSMGPAERLLGFEPLPRSGLLGPVRIAACQQMRIRMDRVE